MGVEQYQSKWAYARCASLTAEESDKIFFLSSGRPKKVPAHRAFCDGCPIINFCLSYAIVHDEEGIWGGMTKNQRDLLGQDVKNRLIVEAKNQGWFEERLSVDELVRLMIQQNLRRQIDSIELSDEEEFDLFLHGPLYESETEYVEQILQESCTLPAQSLVAALHQDFDNGQHEGSSESLFGFPSP